MIGWSSRRWRGWKSAGNVRLAESVIGEKKAKPCYTESALSDLVVSGGLPSEGNLAQHRFPPSLYSVTT